jgi:hypothetical protein
MSTRAKRTTAGDKTICLPIAKEIDYETFVKDTQAFRVYLDKLIEEKPELFPKDIGTGYCFHGFVESERLEMTTRRIRLKSNGQAYQLRPDTVMPYMVGTSEEVEKGLYLRRYGVPYEGLAHVLGHSAMFWWRVTQSLGRASIVGTTVKDPGVFPPDLAADEKHTWWLGERVYVATTAAAGCILGAGVSETADAEGLTAAYGEFQQEALEFDPEYQPQSVNTDGWSSTQLAWKKLFPGITLMLCLLHTILGFQQAIGRKHPCAHDLVNKLWHLYESPTARSFGQRLRRLREWASGQSLPQAVQQGLDKLQQRAPQFKLTFALPDAYRTSNQVDRLMNYQDRILYAMQYFHGTKESMRQGLRAMAFLWNFHPYSRKVQAMEPHSQSPFEDLNGFRYHDNWLRNFLIASSLNGRGTGKPAQHKVS